MAVTESKISVKNKNTTLPGAKLRDDNMSYHVRHHPKEPLILLLFSYKTSINLYFIRQVRVEPDQICFDISDGTIISRDLEFTPHSRAVHKRYCRF